MPKRCASVYRRKGKLLIASASQTPGRHGLWIEAGPHLMAEVDDPRPEIGEKVREALAASRRDEPYPDDPESIQVPLLQLAGVKSWSTFMRGASQCFVEQEDDGVRFIPSHRDGGGFVPRADALVTVNTSTDAGRLAEALFEALARADA